MSSENMQNYPPSLPVETALNILGGKWKVLIVWHLKESTRRYAELKRLIPNITEKVLIRQLRELEEDGIIERHDYQTMPLKVEYRLSPYGQSLMPVLEVLCQWGKVHLQTDES